MKKIIIALSLLILLSGCQQEKHNLITQNTIGDLCAKYNMIETVDGDTMANEISYSYASNALDKEGRFSFYFYIMNDSEMAMKKIDELYMNLKSEEGLPTYLQNSGDKQVITLDNEYMHYMLVRYDNTVVYGFGNTDGAPIVDNILKDIGYTADEVEKDIKKGLINS